VNTLRKGIGRCLLVVALAVTAGLGLASPAPAWAYMDCTYTPNQPTMGSPYSCRYTQISNNNWPSGSTDPDCHNMCMWWPRAPQTGDPIYISYTLQVGNTNRAQFYSDAQSALYAWSGQPYNSPWAHDCSADNSCGNPSIFVRGGHYGNSQSAGCGQSNVINYASNNGVFSTYSDYNFDQPFSQGTNNYGACNAIATIYHEVGHTFTEGHSTVPSDVMYWQNQSVTTIDGDAQRYLNAMYGPYQGHSHSGSGCSHCRAVCGQVCTLAGQDLEGYLDKAWSLSQGVVPPAPDPMSMITPPGCAMSPYQIWLNCTADWIRTHILQ
jgi:hypothetical protein